MPMRGYRETNASAGFRQARIEKLPVFFLLGAEYGNSSGPSADSGDFPFVNTPFDARITALANGGDRSHNDPLGDLRHF